SDDIWKMIGGLSDDPNPQNEDVPLSEGRRALCKLSPRHLEGLLQSLLLAVAPYVANEICRVSFRHQQPVSGGGSLDCSSKPSYCTNSSAVAKELSGTHRLQRVARCVDQLPARHWKKARDARTGASMSPPVARERTSDQDITSLASFCRKTS